MKKLLIAFLIISVNSFSQEPIDTIYVRNLSLRAEEWYWLKAQWTPGDSLGKKAWKKMRNTLTAAAPPTNGTQIVIDSIPGRIALFFYFLYTSAGKQETSYMSNDANSIGTKIKAYTPLIPFCTLIDDSKQAAFQNNRKNGKDDFDN